MNNLEVQENNQPNQKLINTQIHNILNKSLKQRLCPTCGILGFDNAIRQANH